MTTVTNPYNLEEIGQIPEHTATDVEQALTTAQALFKNRDQWLPAHQRLEILAKLKEKFADNFDDIAKTSCAEGGKPWKDTQVEVQRAIDGIQLAIEHLGQVNGTQIPMDTTPRTAGRTAFTQREPIGVCVAVSAFNHPVNLIVHQVIPAVAVGCPIIVKPAEGTPLSARKIIELLHESGLPKDWAQILHTSNEASEKLVTDNRVAFFTFIGSARVGWMLRSKLAPGTRCALEHGGVAPAILTQSTDLERAIPALTQAGYYHAGQVCVSAQRLYVHDDLMDEFKSQFTQSVESLTVGDQLDQDTDVGPLIRPGEVDRIHEWVEEAIAAGAELITGGKKLSDTTYAPTILLNPPADAKVSTEEIFGPVTCLYSYRDDQEAIDASNSLDVAFQAAVWGQDIDQTMNLADQLDATAVMINDHTAFRADWMPFGGRRHSGLGLGGIPYTMHDMTQPKLIVIKRD